MGFLDSIKSKINAVKNYMGEAADVSIEIEPTSPNDTVLKGKIWAKTKSTDFDIQQVQLRLRCEEKISFYYDANDRRNSDQQRESDNEHDRHDDRNTKIKKEHIHVNHTFKIADGQNLKMNSEYTWDFNIPLPADRIKSFKGYFCEIKWEICAVLEKSGNDPYSDYITINI